MLSIIYYLDLVLMAGKKKFGLSSNSSAAALSNKDGNSSGGTNSNPNASNTSNPGNSSSSSNEYKFKMMFKLEDCTIEPGEKENSFSLVADKGKKNLRFVTDKPSDTTVFIACCCCCCC